MSHATDMVLKMEGHDHTKLKKDEFHALLEKIAHLGIGAVHKFRRAPDGAMSMPYASPSIAEIYGITAEEIQKDLSPIWKLVNPDDLDSLLMAIEDSARELKPFQHEWRLENPVRGEIWVTCLSVPEKESDGSIVWHGFFQDITALKLAEKEHTANLHYFESMDRVNRAIQSAENLDQMMRDVLDTMLDIFDCDRAWFVYPCDPDAETMRVPMECTRPEYPGGFAAGLDYPVTANVANTMRLCLECNGPVAMGPGTEHPEVPELAVKYNVQSFIVQALYPKIGKPWEFGLHQCTHTRIWTAEERRLLSEIGRRISDGLTSLLVSRDLQESEERFRLAFDSAGIGMGIISMDGHWLRANHTVCDMLGYTEKELQGITSQELIHPDDLNDYLEGEQKLIAGEIPYMQIEKRYRHRDGHYLWAKLTTSIVRGEDNEPLYFVSQIENIDKQRRAERELTLLSFALNHVNEGVYLINEDGQFKYVNDEACHVLEYNREELLDNMGVPDIDPDYQMSHWQEHWLDIKQRVSVTLETLHRTKTGKIIPVEVNANYFEYDGQAYNLALVRDITERKRTEEALRRSEADLRLALDAGRLGDWKWDLVSGEAIWSRRCKALYGLPPDADVSYESFLSLVHPEDRDEVAYTMKQALKTGTDFAVENRIIQPEGSVLWTAVRGRVFRDTVGHPMIMAGITMDITERKQAEEARRISEAALRESDERFRQMADNIHEVFWLTDVTKQEMLYISPAYESIWGRSCESLYADPRQWLEAIHPDDRDEVRDAAVYKQTSGKYDVEYRIIRPDGTMRYIHDRAFPIQDENGKVFRVAGTAQDITDRKEHEAHIQYLAYHDALTGLPNRELVMNRLTQAISQSQRHDEMLAVLFLDLDRFKTINDTLGHPAGDELLQQIAVCLADVLREDDTIGRVGGDEYLILLPGLSHARQAAFVTRKILNALSAPFKIANHELHVNASIGISLYPQDSDHAETLVKYADSALYLAKDEGRNTFRFFSPELDARVRARLRLETDLRSALEKDQLQLVYQPLMDMDSGQFIGAEALLRWQHPELGNVSPVDFIPVAEETGMIVPIGEWVLHTACTQASTWQAAGIPDFKVSVNLSRRQLEQSNLAENIDRILQETGCNPHLLELEITESSTMTQPEEAIVRLKELHEMGISLALDDFGTGYSSLAYLKRFPLHRIKIDRSFVEGIPDDSDDMAIVNTTIVLARQLRLNVIAEGVESDAQRVFLEGNGCNEMQGYLFGKPMPAGELERHPDFPGNQLAN